MITGTFPGDIWAIMSSRSGFNPQFLLPGGRNHEYGPGAYEGFGLYSDTARAPMTAAEKFRTLLRLASRFADAMLEKGVYIIGFSYPVVPQGKARIRTQISAAHTREDLEFAIAKFGESKTEMEI